jgi:transcriptional regulator with XRE-family HTH domain
VLSFASRVAFFGEKCSLRAFVALRQISATIGDIRMVIGERLRDLRELRQMSQGDIEKRTGLLRCYISRVENGHTVPSVDTLEKMARALEIPLYRLFTDDAHVKAPDLPKQKLFHAEVNPKDEREL